MVLTQAERMRRYRQKLSATASGHVEEIKRKDAKRKAAKRSNPSVEEKAKRREENTQYCRTYRQKRLKLDLSAATTLTPSPGPYRSVGSLNKAVNRASTQLPCSPRKKAKVVQSLYSKVLKQ